MTPTGSSGGKRRLRPSSFHGTTPAARTRTRGYDVWGASQDSGRTRLTAAPEGNTVVTTTGLGHANGLKSPLSRPLGRRGGWRRSCPVLPCPRR